MSLLLIKSKQMLSCTLAVRPRKRRRKHAGWNFDRMLTWAVRLCECLVKKGVFIKVEGEDRYCAVVVK